MRIPIGYNELFCIKHFYNNTFYATPIKNNLDNKQTYTWKYLLDNFTYLGNSIFDKTKLTNDYNCNSGIPLMDKKYFIPYQNTCFTINQIFFNKNIGNSYYTIIDGLFAIDFRSLNNFEKNTLLHKFKNTFNIYNPDYKRIYSKWINQL